MNLKKLNTALMFYRCYYAAPIFISLVCCALYLFNGKDVVMQLITKLATDGLILYFLTFREEKFFYYYNLHISKALLLISFFIFDMFIFGILLWITCILI